jgi:hypothetical protein
MLAALQAVISRTCLIFMGTPWFEEEKLIGL